MGGGGGGGGGAAGGGSGPLLAAATAAAGAAPASAQAWAEAGEELVLSLAQPHPGYDSRPKGPRGAWGHEAADPREGHREGHRGGHADSAPARRPLTPPMAPHGMLDERPPALRPGAPAFFWQALQVAGLTELGLGSNLITDHGALALAQALEDEDATLTFLNLGGNMIGDRGAFALVRTSGSDA